MKSILMESDLRYLEIFKNRINETGTVRVDVYKYQPIWDEDFEKLWENELFIIKEKYHNINIQLKERIPINSRAMGYYWYLTKDVYGNYYIFLAPGKFEEKFVWKLQYKIYYFLENFSEDIENDQLDEPFNKKLIDQNETKRERIHVQLTRFIKDFNNKIYKEINISSNVNFS